MSGKVDEVHSGKVCHVHSANCVEVNFTLGFDVSVRKKVVLDSVFHADMSEPQREDAAHCLIQLVGGKPVIVRVTGFMPRRVIGVVYATGIDAAGIFADHVEHIPGHGTVVNINSLIGSMKESGNIDPDLVRKALQG